ncbi:STAS domain-containing protein [Streptomyces sp. NPDC096205]|uniref:STAS domain-containing protein n=1 Tax=Streptomyces sp. NPDC096205 TaxID=3366081 RepID=UPI0038281B34
MSTSTTSPILTHPTSRHDTGADTAPYAIVLHSCTSVGDTLVVHLAGEVDHYSAAPVREILAAAHGYTGLLLDTSRVTFADSGLLALVDSWTGPRRRLRMTNTSRPVQRLLDVAAAAGQHPPRSRRPQQQAEPRPPVALAPEPEPPLIAHDRPRPAVRS